MMSRAMLLDCAKRADIHTFSLRPMIELYLEDKDASSPANDFGDNIGRKDHPAIKVHADIRSNGLARVANDLGLEEVPDVVVTLSNPELEQTELYQREDAVLNEDDKVSFGGIDYRIIKVEPTDLYDGTYYMHSLLALSRRSEG